MLSTNHKMLVFSLALALLERSNKLMPAPIRSFESVPFLFDHASAILVA